jgi:helix-turn-helix protein
MAGEDYLTIRETADLLKVTPKTVRNKMAAGIFRKGIHYFSPPGLAPRFKRSALVAWLEHCEQEAPADDDGIPMVNGYILGEGKKSA